jgi:hypothetical protein
MRVEERLWLLSELDLKAACAYSVAGAFELEGELDVQVLTRSLNFVIGRHETLRTGLVVQDGELCQLVRAELHVQVPVVPTIEEELERALREVACQPFDSTPAPMAIVFRLGPNRHVLALITHHAVVDSWSLGVLADEQAGAYTALRRGQIPSLSSPPAQCADFAARQQARVADRPPAGRAAPLLAGPARRR